MDERFTDKKTGGAVERTGVAARSGASARTASSLRYGPDARPVRATAAYGVKAKGMGANMNAVTVDIGAKGRDVKGVRDLSRARGAVATAARKDGANARKKRKGSARARILLAFLVALLVVTAFEPARGYIEENAPELGVSLKGIPEFIGRLLQPVGRPARFAAAEEVATLTAGAALSESEPGFNNSSLISTAALLASADTGDVLQKKNPSMQIYPASLTKIMTALLAIEKLDELPETVTVPPEIFETLRASNSTMAGFEPGEQVRTLDLIYGVMLPSGGECCLTLAHVMAGSEAGFAALMNARANELGMRDTHFTNATGLHDENHYSTVRDMAGLLLRALRNERFEEVFTAETYTSAPTAIHPDGLVMRSGLFSRLESKEFNGGRILGGKMGYTDEAGRCLASLAEKNGRRYIFVSVGNGLKLPEIYNISDAVNAYENGIRDPDS